MSSWWAPWVPQQASCFSIGTAFGSDAIAVREGWRHPAPISDESSGSVLEALADLCNIILRHELGACVEIGRRDAAVDLKIKLQDRPEALQEGLLSQRTGQVAGGNA